MIRVAICDDCEQDRGVVSEYVQEYIQKNGLKVELFVYDHPDEMLEKCASLRPQIYVLDIVMPWISGIEAAREIKWNQKEAHIIFATSEPSFALESFDVNPVNYILKPIDKQKLFQSLDIAFANVEKMGEKAVAIKVKGGMKTLFLEEIAYIEYRNHTATYYLLTGENFTTTTFRVGFKEYLQNYHANSLIVLCHESFAVSIAAIDMLTKTEIILRNQKVIPVSKSRYQEVANQYLEYRFN